MNQPIDYQLTHSQRWILAVSGLLTILREGDPEYFGGGVPVKHSIWAREKLKINGVATLGDLYRNFRQSLDYIPDPLVLSKSLTDDDDIVFAFKADAFYPPDEGDNTWWQNRNSLGWNLMRTTHLAGLAYVACMIPQDEAWNIATLTARIFQRIFDNWDDVYKAAKYSMSIGDIDGKNCYDELKKENGLWTLPWKINIENAECPPQARRIWQVGVNRQFDPLKSQATLSFAEAIQQAAEGDCLQLAAGVYTGPWHINKSIEIFATESNVICQSPDDAAASLVTADAFVLIRNIQFISPGGGNRGQVAIGCVSGTLLLEHIKISSTGHGISIANPAKVILFKCLLDSCALNGVVVEGVLEASYSSFLNIQYHSATLNHQAYATFVHCLFKDSGTHMLSVDNESFARISDSQLENSTQAAFVITNQSSLEIIRCKVIKAGLIALNVKRCFILDTEFEGAPTYYQAQQQIAVFSQVNETVLVNCSFRNATYHAVHIDQAENIRIENSLFSGEGGSGLIISNSQSKQDLSIKNSVINTLHGEMAVTVNHAQSTFINCSIEGGSECSLLSIEGSVINLRSCQFKHSPKVAVLIRNQASCIANNCRFTKTELSAIDVMDGLAQFTLCYFTYLQGYGFRIQGQSNVSLSECKFENVKNQCITATGPSIINANKLDFTKTHPHIISLENQSWLTLESTLFEMDKEITISIKNATLAHRNCDAITNNDISINNDNGNCLSLNH